MKIKLLITLSLLIIIVSCSKKRGVDCSEQIDPGFYIIPTDIFFKLADKTTSKDLFFSANPVYKIEQITFTQRWTDDAGVRHLIPVTLSIDSSRMCFVTDALIDTLFIQITNLQPDTLLTVSMKPIPYTACSFMYYADSVKFDNQIYVAGDKQIITLKK
ncbi:MAG: hypothetical protein LBE82_02795 [Chitinophagaceae bacterium]|jgi:hypothetical protein|nr:hypothetical protein [Chitinophagaceae bacterium]